MTRDSLRDLFPWSLERCAPNSLALQKVRDLKGMTGIILGQFIIIMGVSDGHPAMQCGFFLNRSNRFEVTLFFSAWVQ